MEERDKKKMDQLKKKLHTDDEGTFITLHTLALAFISSSLFSFNFYGKEKENLFGNQGYFW